MVTSSDDHLVDGRDFGYCTRCGTPVSSSSVVRRGASHNMGEEGGSLREPHVPSALLYGLDDLVGHFLAGDVDDEPRAVEAPEGLGRSRRRMSRTS